MRRNAARKSRRDTQSERGLITVEDATSAITRDYYEDVKGVGDDIIRAIKDGEIENEEDADRYLHETIDGTQRVIYTWQARLGLLASSNADAYFEEGLGELVCTDSVPYEQLMYWALRADVLEYLGREDIDIFDPETYEEEEDEED